MIETEKKEHPSPVNCHCQTLMNALLVLWFCMLTFSHQVYVKFRLFDMILECWKPNEFVLLQF